MEGEGEVEEGGRLVAQAHSQRVSLPCNLVLKVRQPLHPTSFDRTSHSQVI